MFGNNNNYQSSYLDQLKYQSKQELQRACSELHQLSQNNHVGELITILQMTQKAIKKDSALSRHQMPEDRACQRALIQEKIRTLSERSPTLVMKVLNVRAKFARLMTRARNNPYEQKYREQMGQIEQSCQRVKEKLVRLRQQAPPQQQMVYNQQLQGQVVADLSKGTQVLIAEVVRVKKELDILQNMLPLNSGQ